MDGIQLLQVSFKLRPFIKMAVYCTFGFSERYVVSCLDERLSAAEVDEGEKSSYSDDTEGTH
jgi:hypothetical protein